MSLDVDITDHAVVRWIERVEGIDLNRIREEIRAAVMAGGIVHLPGDDAATYIEVAGRDAFLVVRNLSVTTVIPVGQRWEGEP